MLASRYRSSAFNPRWTSFESIAWTTVSLPPIASLLLFLCFTTSAFAAPGDYLAKPDAWYASPEAKQIADNILSYQSPLGGWPKNIDTAASPYAGAKTDIAPTFDNRATSDEMRYLSRMFAATSDDRYRAAFFAGLDYILTAQYPTGGWPQSYPIRPKTYHRHITFNDDAMARVLLFLQEIAKSPRYEFVPIERRTAAKEAFDRGIDCILKCQVIVNGKKTVWCAQHDELDYQPRKGRWHELPSLSGAESLGILRVLMSIEQPRLEIIEAVDAAARWYEQSKIVGYRIEQHPDAKEPGKFRTAIPDDAAPPLWARMYDIATNQPLVAGMDSVPHLGMNEIGYGRPSYQWFGEWPKHFLEVEYPAWKQRL